MNPPEIDGDEDQSLMDDSYIGHILIQMKTEFNKPNLIESTPSIESNDLKLIHNDIKILPNAVQTLTDLDELRIENGTLTEANVEIIDNYADSRENGFEIDLDNVSVAEASDESNQTNFEDPNETNVAEYAEEWKNDEEEKTIEVVENQPVENSDLVTQAIEESSLEGKESSVENNLSIERLEVLKENKSNEVAHNVIDKEVEAKVIVDTESEVTKIDEQSNDLIEGIEPHIEERLEPEAVEPEVLESVLVTKKRGRKPGRKPKKYFIIPESEVQMHIQQEGLNPELTEKLPVDTRRRGRKPVKGFRKIHRNPALTRSSRRLSKDYSETVLQSAIARKAISYNETAQPQRLSKRTRPQNLQEGSPYTFKREYKLKSDQDVPIKIELSEEPIIEKIEKIPAPIKPKKVKQETVDEDCVRDRTKSVSSTSSEMSIKRRKISEDNSRRRSNRRPGSPHVAEQAEKVPPNAPESAVVGIHPEYIFKKCLCLKKNKLEVQFDENDDPFCSAVDCIDGKSIGCNNLSAGKGVRRPSTRIPFLILCKSHLQRLVKHNCCPGCGMFCTEGVFVHCPNGHQYHRECLSIIDFSYLEGKELKKVYCLHCGMKTKQKDVQLSMSAPVKPTFLPFQRSYHHSAKMSIQHRKFHSDSQVIEKNGIILEIEPSLDIPKLYPMNGKYKAYFSPDHLYDAAEKGDVEKLVEILASGIDVQQFFDSHDGDTALHAACNGGHKLAAYVLLTAGASINAMNARQHTCLMAAVFSGHDHMLEFLVKNGATVDLKGPDGMTALHIAAKIGYTNGCKILTNVPNTNKIFLDERDDGGWTPLVWACEHAHSEAANYLLFRGADPQVRDLEQNVPLHWAAFGGNYEIVDLLIKLGVDVNAINVHRESPLHIAARQDRYDCVLLLLAHKAKPDVVNSDGETPLTCCGEKESDTKNIINLNVNLRSVISNITQRDPILSNDISNGKELNPMQCVNYVDKEDKPTDFVYLTENCFTSNIIVDRKITTLQSCTCENRCGTESCQCNSISLRCWYDDQERLLPEFDYLNPPMIFECNQACSCNQITCRNRVVQKGLTQRFQIMRTETKGWGVRTLRFIQRGTYVCEYVGEILSDMEADQREDDSYLFDLDSRVRKLNIDGDGCEGETYCIDARKYGNLARFINHHCLPNLLPVRVFIDHHDLHFPRIAFFANRDIAADEELGFDYGEKFWIIKSKLFTCTCGAPNCRYSESTIESTLKAYQLKEEQLQQQIQQQKTVVVN